MWGELDDALLHEMMERIDHRGPDGRGSLTIGECALGHVRLAIVDVANGAQPMTNECGNLAVTFNGEIYNHVELRRQIEGDHIFETRSDTEVLVHLYEQYGEDMLSKLDGMFAFAMAGPEGMLLARDPIGIKPLYYGRKGATWLAASELKAFPGMDELQALPAGHAMLAGGEPWPYSHPYPPKATIATAPFDQILQSVRTRLNQAVVKRLMSDVPLGVFLSGGLDSSLIAAMMRPHTQELLSFSAGMEGAPDLEAARTVAEYLGTQHYELVYTERDIERHLPDIIYYLESFDAPLVRSAIPMYFLSELAAQHVKVVLTGEGADELFAGYQYLKAIEDQAALHHELSQIVIRLQDTNLQRADRVTMKHGLEARVPFLDYDLVRFVTRLPAELKGAAAAKQEKWLLRQACEDLLPAQILYRDKLKFSEGAGSSGVVAERVRDQISPSQFERERHIAPGLTLRSPEELHYYQIWRTVTGGNLSPSMVGRTRDLTAAA